MEKRAMCMCAKFTKGSIGNLFCQDFMISTSSVLYCIHQHLNIQAVYSHYNFQYCRHNMQYTHTCQVLGRIPLSSQAINMAASLSPAPWSSGLSLIISRSEGGTPITTPIWYQRAATELLSIFCISLTDSSEATVRIPSYTS